MNASVAICIPTFNQAQFLGEAVESAFSQEGISPPEVWVSDDASTDSTPEVLSTLKVRFPTLQVVRQTSNRGIGGNPNWVLRQPKTDILVRLDSDDRLSRDYCRRLTKLLIRYPKAGYAHAAVQEIDENSKPGRGRILHRKSGFQDADDALRESVNGYRVAANIIAFRRTALEEAGFIRPEMNFAEDWDLSVRIAAKGWGNVYDASILSGYRVWIDSKGFRANRKLDEIRGIRSVFECSLQPAWIKRGWSISTLNRARRKFAFRQADVFLRKGLSPEEASELETALRDLGSSKRLEVFLRLSKLKVGPLAHRMLGAIDLPGRLFRWLGI